MATLKYTVIHTRLQYDAYCDQLTALLEGAATPEVQDEIDLLTLLIETRDREHNTFAAMAPVQLLRSLMDGAGVKAWELAQQLGVSKGLLSDILNYKKGFSKTMVRALAVRFRVAQEAFNRPYALRGMGVEGQRREAA